MNYLLGLCLSLVAYQNSKPEHLPCLAGKKRMILLVPALPLILPLFHTLPITYWSKQRLGDFGLDVATLAGLLSSSLRKPRPTFSPGKILILAFCSNCTALTSAGANWPKYQKQTEGKTSPVEAFDPYITACPGSYRVTHGITHATCQNPYLMAKTMWYEFCHIYGNSD